MAEFWNPTGPGSPHATASPTPRCTAARSPRWDVAAAAAASVPEWPIAWEVIMPVVGGIDIHRAQLTFDYVDLDSGEVVRGRIAPANRERLRHWLQRFAGRDQVAFALEGCTGWRDVADELARAGERGPGGRWGAGERPGAGPTPHAAEPAETAARRGPKRRAKTDRSDA